MTPEPGADPLPPRAAAILARHPGPVRLGASRLKWLGVLAVGLVLGAGGALMIRQAAFDPGISAAMGWFTLAFFALTALVAAVQLLPAASGLVLDAEGFEARTLFRGRRHAWTQAHAFTAWDSGHAKIVVFEAGSVAPGRLAAVDRGLTGRDAALGDTYGLRAAELAALMEAWRRRALGAG